MCALSSASSAAAATEYQLKAAFLFNFLQFVDWPASAFAGSDESLAICVLGPDPFGADLDALVAGESIQGRRVDVRRIDRIDAATNCHLLFLSQRPLEAVRDALEQLKGHPVLTVSDLATFAGSGGMIEFVTQNGRIRLRVNLDAANAAQLRLSSKLLRRSEIVGHTPA